MSTRWTPLRLARWGIVSAAVALAITLVAIGYSNYVAVRSASNDVVRGAAVGLVDSLRGALRNPGGPPVPEDLEDWFTEFEPSGVRFVRISGPIEIELGVPATARARMRSRRGPLEIARVGSRVRVTAKSRVRPRRPRRRPTRRVDVVLEFEPVVADRLAARATRGLIVNSSVALALLLLSTIAFRWLAGREAIDELAARRKHLAKLGEMSAVLAHELKNPLASLKGNAQLLAETLQDDEKRGAKANRVVAESVRIESLIAGLLEFVRTGEIDRMPCAPADVVREAASSLGDERIEVDAQSSPATAQLDSPRIRQAVSNLMGNALEVSPESARVTVTVGSTGGDLRISVRDRGPGLPEEDPERLFEPFFTTKTRGTGLGLALSRRIAEAHGGTIVAANHPDGGAVFTLIIPMTGDS